MEKTVKIYNESFEEVLTDIPNLKFLDFDEEGVEVQVNSQEMKGRDGVGLLGPATFGPYNLILRFFYTGQDTKDYNLLKQRLRALIFRRDPYFIVHSDMPGKKYAVYPTEVGIEDIGTRYGTFEMQFVVYKGYSESLLNTSQFSLDKADKWQFEGGHLSDSNIKYKHTASSFKIYNGSTDAINPTLGYEMLIKINADAPNGFKLTNHTTGDVFEYKKAIKKNSQLIIDGVHPLINNKRVGVDTNWGWINLDKGFNDIEITGKNLGTTTVEFIFNFVYR
ncbi:phage tail domain-containing protein [Staphylococcus saprophyticus]|uniref:phage tail domain-containing protein n=1 Tax=Staphylococcus saprophyticus TaxID=29385 RepID=UPI000E67D227|nr:phage tail domain-containing protein [Staphylococcus saprophyticus]RIO25452.1 phage tail family protein [Staphylococcus saprophyticus]